MRLSLICGTLLSALIINARVVVTSSRGAAFQDTQCKGNKCSVTVVPEYQRSTLHARVILPKPGKPEGEPGGEGGSGAGGEGAPGSSNDAGDDGTGGAGSDGRWGAGGAGDGEAGVSQWPDIQFTRADEIDRRPSPPAVGPVSDFNQAWAHQSPLPQFSDLFKDVRDFSSYMVEPDKAIFWSSGTLKGFAPDGSLYANKASEVAQLGSKIDPMGLQIFSEFYGKWIKLPDGRELDAQIMLLAEDDPVRLQYWDIVCAAVARVSSGDVHVVLPVEGLELPGVWGTSEFPELQRNEDVHNIYWVNPNYPKADPVKTLVWSRTDGYIDPDTQRWPLNTPMSDSSVFPLRST